MMNSTFKLVAPFLAVFLLWTVVDATTEETIDLRLFNRDFVKVPESKMLDMLERANLESHGYKKELETKLISESESESPLYQKMYFYYKTVDCSKVPDIEQELETLIPGGLGVDLVKRFNQEVIRKGVDSMMQCKVGLEVHFEDDSSCSGTGNNRRKKRSPCVICIGRCRRVSASITL